MSRPDVIPVRTWLLDLQDRICHAFEKIDGEVPFREERFESAGGGLARPRVLEGGPVLEKAAVSFSHSLGDRLPSAATERRPDLAGRGFEAASLSLITHPRNPYAPTSHMNLRVFLAAKEGVAPVWWFGGGFDLTPCYGFDEDAVHWHRAAKEACDALGDGTYERFKAWCDGYFYLPHRNENRCVGGLFFDDLYEPGFDACFAFLRAAGDAYLDAYLPILRRRMDTP